MKFTLFKGFLSIINKQKFIAFMIIIMTSFSSMFSVGIIGFFVSSKSSFDNIARITNLQSEIVPYTSSMNSWLKSLPSSQRPKGCYDNNEHLSCVQSVFFQNENPLNPDQNIEKMFPELKNINFEKTYQVLGANIEYNVNKFNQGLANAVIAPATEFNDELNQSQMADAKQPFFYNKLYTTDAHGNIKIITGMDIEQGHCYVSQIWANAHDVKIGDSIVIGSGANATTEIIDGFASTLNNFSPTSGSVQAVFGTPSLVPSVFINSATDFYKIYHLCFDSSTSAKTVGDNTTIASYLAFSKTPNSAQNISVNKSWYDSLDSAILNGFKVKNESMQPVNTFSGQRYYFADYNNFLKWSFINFFLWNSMLTIYLLTGIILSVIFWVFSLVILFIALKRNIEKAKPNIIILKSLGYRDSELSFCMLAFPIVITLLSIIIGFVSGYFFQFFLRSQFQESFNFSVFITIPTWMYFACIGLLFIGTNLISYFYLLFKLGRKSIISLLQETKNKTPKIIWSIRPFLNTVKLKHKFTFLFGLKNVGKIIASFFIVASSFVLMSISVVAIITSVNFTLSLTRGYNYNQTGSLNDGAINIVCNNPELTSGSKSCYILDLNNLDYTDSGTRFIPVTLNVQRISMENDKEYQQQADNIFNSYMSMKNILESYTKLQGNPVNALSAPYVHQRMPENIINLIQKQTFYFADNGSSSNEGWQKFQQYLIADLNNPENNLTPGQVANILSSTKYYLQAILTGNFQSIGFNFKNVNFNKETFGSDYSIKGAPEYPNFDIYTFLDTPNQSSVFKFNDSEFNNMLNNFVPNDTETTQTIPIIVNKSFGVFRNYANPNYKPAVGQTFAVPDLFNSHKYVFKIIYVYDSFGFPMAWTSNKYSPAVNHLVNDSRVYAYGQGTSKTSFAEVYSSYFKNSFNYSNYGLFESFGSGRPSNSGWPGNIREFSAYQNTLSDLYATGFASYINKLIIIFSFVATLAILISFFCLLIFMLIILYDDAVMFSVLRILGYRWWFSVKQVLKIYVGVVIVAILSLVFVMDKGFGYFNGILLKNLPLDLRLMYSWVDYVIVAGFLVLILFINFFVCLRSVKKENPLEKIKEESN